MARWVVSAMAVGLLATPALGQQHVPGQYGGGFIEFLMTGNPGGRGGRSAPAAHPGHAAYPAPAYRVAPVEPYGPYADPYPVRRAMPAHPGERAAPVRAARPSAPRTQHAALGAPETYRPIGRAVDPKFERQVVDYATRHPPGTIVIDTPAKFLYLVQPGGKALRYGIGVGRPGFEWAGMKSVTMKREWPDWRPPAEMLKRRPDLPRFVPGGPDNPLGARALYLGSTLYRIHGTNEPETIGEAVSSGCIRMTNDDVVDLYERVKVGAKVLVI
jgi:lipoprotein-anchoring transpeptidase ErfK/SrfK